MKRKKTTIWLKSRPSSPLTRCITKRKGNHTAYLIHKKSFEMDCRAWVGCSPGASCGIDGTALGHGDTWPGQDGRFLGPYQWALGRPRGASKPCRLKKNWWLWQNMWTCCGFYFSQNSPDAIAFSHPTQHRQQQQADLNDFATHKFFSFKNASKRNWSFSFVLPLERVLPHELLLNCCFISGDIKMQYC